MTNMSTLIYLLILVAIIAIGAIVYFFFFNKKKEREIPAEPKAEPQNPILNPDEIKPAGEEVFEISAEETPEPTPDSEDNAEDLTSMAGEEGSDENKPGGSNLN